MPEAVRPIRAWLTTPDRRQFLAPRAVPPLAKGGAGGGPVLRVSDVPGQPMVGFGGALTDSSAVLLWRLPPARRDALLVELFHPTRGLGFSALRLPIGATDFSARGSYTYNDLPPGQTDPEMKRFSLGRDREYVIPLLKRVRQINPALKIVASPWTAPAWMKTGRNLHGGWLDWPAYPAYAKYLTRFLQEYAAAGVPIWAVTVQNEPRHEVKTYPCMRMEPRDQARFIRDHFGPALRAAGLKTKIFAWDHNWDQVAFPMEVLADAGARRYISGVAFHGYGGQPSAQEQVRRAYPDQEIHFTESSGGEWAKDFGGNLRWDIQNLIAGSVRHGARTVLKWNLALDENHGPRNGGCNNCRGIVTIHSRTGEVTRNEEYYAFAHASRFVRPGARYLETTDDPALPNVAFRNPDGTTVWVACNLKNEARAVTLAWGGYRASVSVPAGSALTLRWN
jgi:glucosylceramidase